jgi:hypothetical protein
VNAASEDPAEPTPEQPLGEWGTSEPETTWTEIDVEAESAGPGLGGPGPAPQASGDNPTGTEGTRLRRPSSLRSPADLANAVPRRKLTPPQFPKPNEGERPPATAPGTPGASSDPGSAPGPTPLAKFTALVNERPEVGLGVAFLGGLLLATILKRLAR